jgi:DtxR family transcriptional regulator, Mn-dependent transcriptional regulator
VFSYFCFMVSLTEENYIKTIYALSQATGEVYVSDLARKLEVKQPTINSMVKKLAAKKLLSYAPYKGIRMTEKGKKEALSIIRKHRLAELFLVNVMGLGWEEVHVIAEELEHVNSQRLFQRMDEMLNYPRVDPHGEPIPDEQGKILTKKNITLNDVAEGSKAVIVAVADDAQSFLDHLNKKGLQIGDSFTLKKRETFDGSVVLVGKQKTEITLSHPVAERILVEG